MSILNDKLETIISDSGLYFYQSEIENEFNVTEDKLTTTGKITQKIWHELPDSANIAIYGLGGGSRHLFQSVDMKNKKVVCMIDNNPKLDIFDNYPVIRSKDMSQHDINIIIITSETYAVEMESDVRALLPESKIIHFWNEFSERKKSTYLYSESNNHPIKKENVIKAISLYESIRRYDVTKDFRYLLYMIYSYVTFRDFRNAFIYIEEYLNSDYKDNYKIANLKNNLRCLLDEIKQNLASKQNKNCLVMIADSMRADDISHELTPFLFGLAQNNIHCTNAYTHIGWTTGSVLTIFKQKSYFDHHLYKDVKIRGDEYLFENLLNNQIEFNYYWPISKYLFDDTLALSACQNGCADLIWQYLCGVFENDGDDLAFMHFTESHAPYLCLPYGNDPGFMQENHFYSIKYIDQQIEFLFSLLPKHVKVLFCSDHGHVRCDSKYKTILRYNNDYCHIPYIICDGLTHNTDKRMVSHLDTANILMNLLDNRPAFEGVERRNFVEINEEFPYDQQAISITNNMKNRGDICKLAQAFKCFITNKDKYVIFNDGEERYFLLPDDDTNLIDDPEYTDRINWFRSNVNTQFPDWNDDNGRYEITRKYFEL